jgi:hypothetical protein
MLTVAAAIERRPCRTRWDRTMDAMSRCGRSHTPARRRWAPNPVPTSCSLPATGSVRRAVVNARGRQVLPWGLHDRKLPRPAGDRSREQRSGHIAGERRRARGCGAPGRGPSSVTACGRDARTERRGAEHGLPEKKRGARAAGWPGSRGDIAGARIGAR